MGQICRDSEANIWKPALCHQPVPESLIRHAVSANQSARYMETLLNIYIYIYIYVWIYENKAKGVKSLTKRASFFSSPETISKGDNIKQSFFPSFTPLSCFHCPPVSISCPFTWLESGLKVK